MNILFLINHAGKGGTEKYIYVLSQYLLKKGNKIFFLYNEPGQLVDNMNSLGVVTEQINLKGPFDFKAVNYIKEYCDVFKINIIHTNFPRENYIAIQVKRKYPEAFIIYTSHIIVEDTRMRKFLNKIMLKNVDEIIAVCTKNKEQLIENNYPANKINIIFNGVNFKSYVHNVKNSTSRKDYQIPFDEFVFVTVTRFGKEKGLLYLLESIKVLRTLTKSKFKLILVGDGEEEETLRNFLKDNKELEERVIFTGYVEDPTNILMGADCYINSSSNEALSFSILEAMSKALPIIATRVGGNSDIINDETDCGILVRYGSKVRMARAMEKMMIDEKFYDKCSINANKAIKEVFNIDILCDKTYELYNKVLGAEKTSE